MLELLLALLLSLCSVDLQVCQHSVDSRIMMSSTSSKGTYVLNKRTLVLECVTLAQVVEFVVEMLVDLASGAVLDEQTAEDTKTTHPQSLSDPLFSIHSFFLSSRVI